MKPYTTINQVKQNLPEIIDRISTCKKRFDSCTILLEKIQNWCVEEAVDSTKDYGWWTTLNAYAKYLKIQMEAYAEMEYLKGLVGKIQQYPNL